MGEEIFVKLRDCFTAGYTLPQYCIDNGIKKPLFVTEEKFLHFAWEIYVQFRYDKKMYAQFSVLDMPTNKLNFSVSDFLSPLQIKNISEVNLVDFDAIILLTYKKVTLNGRVIPFTELVSKFIYNTYVKIPFMSFLQHHPEVKLILTNFPSYKGSSEFYSQLWDYRPMQKALIESKNKGIHLPTPFDKLGYTNSQAISLLADAFAKTNPDGTTTLFDNNDPLIRIQSGKRVTAYQPEKFLNKIYILGTCHHYGTNAPFDKTIASHLQKMLNEANLPYRVENEGQCYWGRYQDVFYNLNKLPLLPGDIIIIFLQNYVWDDNSIPFCDVSDAFDPPVDYREVFCTKWHVNELGYKLVAEKFFKFLTENNFFKDHEIKYPPPQCTLLPSLWHTTLVRARRRKKFFQRGTGAIQANFAGEKNSNRSNRHELQSVHARSSLSCRIRGGKSRAAVYFCRGRGSERISLCRQI